MASNVKANYIPTHQERNQRQKRNDQLETHPYKFGKPHSSQVVITLHRLEQNTGGVLVRVSIPAVKHHDQKASCSGKGLFSLHFDTVVYY